MFKNMNYYNGRRDLEEKKKELFHFFNDFFPGKQRKIRTAALLRLGYIDTEKLKNHIES